MIPIRELLNKIQWDPRECGDDYVFFYLDRVKNTLMSVPFSRLLKCEGGFMTVQRATDTVEIPLHRMRMVERKGKLVWKRVCSKSL